MRTYETAEKWKSKARDVFYSANGDSNLSRNRVAATVRQHFVKTPPQPEDVERWNEGFEKIETVHVAPPKVSDPAYVDWLYLADYLLLACASPTEEFDEENQRRETEFRAVLDSYKLRMVVHDAREIMRQDGTLKNKDVLGAVKKTHPNAKDANVVQARKLEKNNVLHAPPVKPVPSQPMPLYTPLYSRD
jgi:hypothetical protein